MVLILQIRKLRLREVKSVAQGHAAKIWRSSDSNAGLLILIPVPFLANHIASKDCSSSASHPILSHIVCFHQDCIHCI